MHKLFQEPVWIYNISVFFSLSFEQWHFFVVLTAT